MTQAHDCMQPDELRERLVREENAKYADLVSAVRALEAGMSHDDMLADGWTMLTHSAGYGR